MVNTVNTDIKVKKVLYGITAMMFEVYLGEGRIAYLRFHEIEPCPYDEDYDDTLPKTATVDMKYTYSKYRKKGLQNLLWSHAEKYYKKLDVTPLHSTNLTDLGKLSIREVREAMSEEELAHTIFRANDACK